MVRIANLVDEYIGYKRGLGYKIRTEGATLLRFADGMEKSGYDGPMCRKAAIGWIDGFGDAGSWYRSRLYETLRTFSKYACTVDPESTALPKGSGECHGRTEPYIYTEAEAEAMMGELASLYSPDGLRAASLPMAFGLMYSCGLRPGECAGLKRSDYDSGAGAITVAATKFNRQRLVPLSRSAAAAVEDHLRATASRPDGPMLARTGGRPLDVRALEYAWQTARRSIAPEGGCWKRRPPRPYDCRHSFCVRTIERWLGSGCDVNAMLPFLSLYMGHRKLADTYWYLTATDALLDTASDIFWSHVGGDLR